MTTDHPDGFEPASLYLDAAILPKHGSVGAKALRTLATLAAGLMTNDLESGPSVLDLVVTRRESGNEVLRVSAGTVQESDRLLARVRHDLDTKSVADFIAEWRAPDSDSAPVD
ncbi:hypothetical protein GCM10009775_19480 [Microbacterium aoyamense]|uniref:Uncharacterized protein n=1 Tax=Microbacterium aoyamense TaxID=344166 RepID=A0ABN2PSC6_9MICO|nr:hypothetical protein [Microbacterium aoyamense]